MVLAFIVFILSLVALCKGADYLLDASEKIGAALGLSPLAIGFFLIAFGTSLPELFVSHSASLKGHPEIALGNIIGSNISNVFLIMGVAALWVPLSLAGGEVREQLLLHGLLILILMGLLAWGRLDIFASVLLLSFFVYSLRRAYKKMQNQSSEVKSKSIRFGIWLPAKFLGGLVLLSLGGDFVVQSASVIARHWRVGEYVISAVFVAVGTSLPELFTVIRACLQKRDTNLIVGNVVGSNIFNVAFVMGSLGVYSIPLSWRFLPEVISLMIVSCLFFWFYKCGRNLGRLAGGFLLFGHIGITIYWFVFSSR